MNWQNAVTKLLQVQYPIVQAPMLGVTTPEMVAAIARCGGLGSLPVGGLSPARTSELVKRTKSLTDRPFAVNLFTYDPEPADPGATENMQTFLQQLAGSYGLEFKKQDPGALPFYSYTEQIDILLEEGIRIVSFTFGVPDDKTILRLKEGGVTLIGTATCVKEALFLAAKEIDIVCAQGIEAGGHRGSFLADPELPRVGSMSLIPQVVDHIDKPVLAAGGIWDGRTIKAALVLGALGVQVGTAFIASEESLAIPAYKRILSGASDTDTELTRTFSGRWARGVKNKFMEDVEKSGLPIPPYPVQNSLTTGLRASAREKNDAQFTNLWAGQSAGGVAKKLSADIFMDLVKGVESIS